MRRLKNGTPSTHPLTGRELRELRRHQRESPQSPFVFVSERGAPLSRLASPHGRAGCRRGRLKIKAHPHMLRHACGFKLANDGARHPGAAGLPRAPQHPAHGPLYGAGARSVQGFLAGLTYEASALPRTGVRSVKAVLKLCSFRH